MKAQINKDKLTLAELESQNSGSVNYYEIECEFDESWDGLTKEMVLAKDIEGIHRAVINNKAYIDRDRSGKYEIGFVGYTIENDVKVYQVSTNLVPINIRKGAGEIDILDDVIPTPTEWETYIAQIQAMIDDIEDMDIDVSKEGHVTTVTIRKKDGTVKTVEILDGEKGEQGDPGPQGLPGTPGRDGTDGRDGADAKINGVNTLTIVEGENVHVNQSGSTMIISSDMYDDTEVKQDISALNNDVEGLDGTKQNKQDNTLATINKLIVSAINEIFASVGGIQALISPQASPTNPVVDKDFVNSTVGTNTAIFRGTYNTLAELEQQTATNNDYGFVITTDSAGNTLYNRYKYNGTAWAFEYALNNSSFTAEQWNAITSGITQALVELISTNQNNIATIMADYIKSTDYANSNKGGTFRIDTWYGYNINPTGYLYADIIAYANYLQRSNNAFIGKGTFENALTGKGLVKSTTISSSSTDDNVVTPKAVYDYIESLDISEVGF